VRVEQARAAIDQGHSLNAFISRTTEAGEGVVVAVKDLVDVAGTVTTGGTAPGLLNSEPAAADARVVAEIRRHGGLVVGKTNLHELAFGVTSENEHWGPVRNPRDPERVAGGSSGGSAAAVVAGMCDWAIGTDTGGSIRIPAAFCGCVGFKPTLGLVSTEGVFPTSRSQDVVGPLAADVRTAARALGMMTGQPLGEVKPLDREPRLAVPAGWVDDLDEPTRRSWGSASAGLPTIDFGDRDELAATSIAILAWEFFLVHRQRFEQEPDRLGFSAREGLSFVSQIRSEEAYRVALGRRRQLSRQADERLAGFDALLLPTAPRVAPRIGESAPDVAALLTRFTVPFNVTGQPVINVPGPVGEGELPVGIQVVGHRGEEASLLAVAAVLEARWAAFGGPD